MVQFLGIEKEAEAISSRFIEFVKPLLNSTTARLAIYSPISLRWFIIVASGTSASVSRGRARASHSLRISYT